MDTDYSHYDDEGNLCIDKCRFCKEEMEMECIEDYGSFVDYGCAKCHKRVRQYKTLDLPKMFQGKEVKDKYHYKGQWMPSWIKVTERLPHRNEWVAFVFNGEKVARDVTYQRARNEWEEKGKYNSYQPVSEPITHWMPYPQAPEDK